jgi:transposase
MEVLHARCCGIDVHKASLVACLRVQDGRRRHTEVQSFGTTTAEILRLHAWLSAAGCTHVAMESTGVYWQPVFNLLESSFGVVLANAHHIKAVPGRKTDVKDCEWLADLLAHGLIRASFIPPASTRALRDLTRHRKGLIRDRVKATNRVHKLLEGANIKLGTVVSDVLGVSGRAMLDALVAGETDPVTLATLARGSLVPKAKVLADALRGRFTPHHGFLLGQILTQLDQLAVMVSQCDERIVDATRSLMPHIERLQTIVGVGRRSAEVLVSEIGVDMSRFGRVSVPAPMRVQENGGVLGRAPATTGFAPPSSNPPGRPLTRAAVIWVRNIDGSANDADPSGRPSPWPTASSSSRTTSFGTACHFRIWVLTTSTE